ncbi:polysaccharide pyruvyl transferase family protein [Nocardia jejuensis]|uniref:polysaccharide pyruvyl transferase family protein n=1 Tax=Nocardia jejuensis TaxID=328049 RepID=UPI00082F77FF|nr:polysaccharide pyruvyl transferase family protein [Nocardia jejuensis]
MGTGLPCEGAGHRILIENSEYWLRNYGDLAMLEVTVRRIRERWPNARIGIMTESPTLVAAYFPGAVGITVGASDPWAEPGPLARAAAALGPAVVGPVAEAWLRTRARLLPQAIRVRDRLRDRPSPDTEAGPTDALTTGPIPADGAGSTTEQTHAAGPNSAGAPANEAGAPVSEAGALRPLDAVGPEARGRGRVDGTANSGPHENADTPAETGTSASVVVPRIERRHPGAAKAVRAASLVIALGGGYLTDADLPQAGRVLDLLEYAHGAGVPVAMVGQGLGPMRDPELRGRASEVLARVPLIALRERRRGPELLESLGVPASAVTVTGDDAIELARDARNSVSGTEIGVCLRIAKYSPVAGLAQDAVGVAVRAAAVEFGTGLVPLIIAETPGSPDRATTLPLVRGANAASPVGRFVRPGDVAQQVSRCRVLVTGAYHLAVFALSQGIPVVALTSTEYYDDKFLGLEQMFGGGVRLIHLDDPELGEQLSEAIRDTWKDAEHLRAGLLARADEQVNAGREVFERLFCEFERTHAEHA